MRVLRRLDPRHSGELAADEFARALAPWQIPRAVVGDAQRRHPGGGGGAVRYLDFLTELLGAAQRRSPLELASRRRAFLTATDFQS